MTEGPHVIDVIVIVGIGDVEQKEVEFYVISPFLGRAIFVSGPAPPVPRRGTV